MRGLILLLGVSIPGFVLSCSSDEAPSATAVFSDSGADDDSSQLPDGTAGEGGHGGQAADAAEAGQASQQAVTIIVHNNATSDRYIVTEGQMCDAFSISSESEAGSEPLALQVSNYDENCGCTGGCDLFCGARKWRRLPAGQAFELTWDARALALQTVENACHVGTKPSWTTLEGALAPVPPGTYRVQVSTAGQLPSPSCEEVQNDSGLFSCPAPDWCVPGINPLCPAESNPTVEFVLPDEGDTTVDVFIEPVGDAGGNDDHN